MTCVIFVCSKYLESKNGRDIFDDVNERESEREGESCKRHDE